MRTNTNPLLLVICAALAILTPAAHGQSRAFSQLASTNVAKPTDDLMLNVNLGSDYTTRRISVSDFFTTFGTNLSYLGLYGAGEGPYLSKDQFMTYDADSDTTITPELIYLRDLNIGGPDTMLQPGSVASPAFHVLTNGAASWQLTSDNTLRFLNAASNVMLSLDQYGTLTLADDVFANEGHFTGEATVDGTLTVSNLTVPGELFVIDATVMGDFTAYGATFNPPTAGGSAAATIYGSLIAHSAAVLSASNAAALNVGTNSITAFPGRLGGREFIEFAPVITTLPSDNKYGLRTTLYNNSVSDSEFAHAAILGQLYIDDGNPNDFSNRQSGLYGYLTHQGGGILSSAYGSYNLCVLASTGTISSGAAVYARAYADDGSAGTAGVLFGLRIGSTTTNGASVITNAGGLWIDPQTHGVNSYGIYQSGSTTSNVLNGNTWFGSSILVDGNIGVGTNSPGQKLDVGGYAHFRNGIKTPGYIEFYNASTSPSAGLEAIWAPTGTGGIAMQAGSSVTIQADEDGSGSGVLTLRTKALDRVTIANDGNVGLGTNTPSHKLSIYGSGTNASAIRISNCDTNPPADGASVKRWISITLDDGQTFKTPLYQ